jgi:hypothetical protein
VSLHNHCPGPAPTSLQEKNAFQGSQHRVIACCRLGISGGASKDSIGWFISHPSAPVDVQRQRVAQRKPKRFLSPCSLTSSPLLTTLRDSALLPYIPSFAAPASLFQLCACIHSLPRPQITTYSYQQGTSSGSPRSHSAKQTSTNSTRGRHHYRDLLC